MLDKSVLEYKVVQKKNLIGKKLKKIAIFFKANDLKSSLTFHKLSSSEKWWDLNCKALRADDILKALYKSNKKFQYINPLLLKKYIFLQCLASAFNIDSLKYAVNTGYINNQGLDINIYKDALSELECVPQITKTEIKFLNPPNYTKCYIKIKNSLDYLLKNNDGDMDKTIIKMTKRLPAYKTYIEIRNLTLGIVKVMTKEQQREDVANKKKKEFIDSLKRKPEITKYVKAKYEEMRGAFLKVYADRRRRHGYIKDFEIGINGELERAICNENFVNTIMVLHKFNFLNADDSLNCLVSLIVKLNGKYDKLNEKYKELFKYSRALNDKYNGLSNKYGTLNDKYNQLLSNYGTLESNYKGLEDKYNECFNNYNVLGNKYGSLEDKYNKLEKENRELKKEIKHIREDYKNRCSKLEEENERLKKRMKMLELKLK